MALLTIDAGGASGPFNVDVLDADGTSLNERPLVLTSGRRRKSIVVSPGVYSIVAIRPSGERISRRADVRERLYAKVSLAPTIRSKGNSLSEASARGLLAPERRRVIGTRITKSLESSDQQSARGDHGRSFGDGTLRLRLSDATRAGSAPTDAYRVTTWHLEKGAWAKSAGANIQVEPGHLTIGFEPADPRTPRALGLVDEHGFGLHIVVPPFRDGINLLLTPHALLSVAGSPGSMRSHINAIPRSPSAADILTGLEASSLPSALEILEAALKLKGPAHIEETALAVAEDDPAFALLIAHYLDRFAPDLLPSALLDMVSSALPDAIDGPFLAARAAMRTGSGSSGELMSGLSAAAARPVALLARTRPLLIQAFRLHARDLLAQAAVSEAFIEEAQTAGGLEAFQGHGPDRPGDKWADASDGSRSIPALERDVGAEIRVAITDGRFVTDHADDTARGL